MSHKREIEVICPKCQEKGNFTVWDSINTDIHPEMRDKVLDFSAFTYHCPKCNSDIVTHYDMLYHDVNRRFIVYLMYNKENYENTIYDIEHNQSTLKNIFGDQFGYTYRIVRDINTLIEKIQIFEHGLSDIAIEFLKVNRKKAFHDSNPEFAIDNLYLTFPEKDKYILEYYSNKTFIAEWEFDQEYCDKCNLSTHPKLDVSYIVDENSIIDALHKLYIYDFDI